MEGVENVESVALLCIVSSEFPNQFEFSFSLNVFLFGIRTYMLSDSRIDKYR